MTRFGLRNSYFKNNKKKKLRKIKLLLKTTKTFVSKKLNNSNFTAM